MRNRKVDGCNRWIGLGILTVFLLSLVSCRSDNNSTIPVAQAGPDQSVRVNTTVRLDGSRSSDADGDTLRYR